MNKRVDHIKREIENIHSIIKEVGREKENITIMAVTKHNPLAAILDAHTSGITCIGENRIQEAQMKFPHIPEELDFHFIGHLQSNKAKKAAEMFSTIHSIDKFSTVEALQRHVAILNKTLKIFIEYNTSGETQKQGIRNEEELLKLISDISALENIEMSGLMTMAPYTDNKKTIRSCFRRLRASAEAVEKTFPSLGKLGLSMGMTNDFPIALEEGATIIRVGSLFFQGYQDE